MGEGWDRYPGTLLSQRHLQEMKSISIATSAGESILAHPVGTTLGCFSRGAQVLWVLWRCWSSPLGVSGWRGVNQDENQGNKGMVVVAGYSNEQHPSPLPPRAAEQHPQIIILTRKAFSTQQPPPNPAIPP